MILSNYHTHTVNSDGNNTVDRMVERAVERGFTSLGFSTILIQSTTRAEASRPIAFRGILMR